MSPPEHINRVLLTSHDLTLCIGGIENVVRAKAWLVAADGHDVTVLTRTPDDRRGALMSAGGYTLVRLPTCDIEERRIGVPFPITVPRAVHPATCLMRAAVDAELRRGIGGCSPGIARTRFSKDEVGRNLQCTRAATAAPEVSTHVPA